MFLIEKINYKNIEELKSKSIKKALFSKGKINKKSGGPGAQKLFFVPKRSCGNQAMLQSWQQTTLFSRVNNPFLKGHLFHCLGQNQAL